jgi:heptosyltransferase-3
MQSSLVRNRATLDRWASSAESKRDHIAIVLIEHLGDIIACEPVIRHLRSQHPNSTLVWFVRPLYRELLSAHPELNACLTVTCLSEAVALAADPFWQVVVDLHLEERRCGWFDYTHHKRAGDGLITINNYFHHGSLLESFTRSAGLPGLSDAPRFHIAPSIRPPVISGRYLVLHTASNEASRDWQLEKWLELVDQLLSDGNWILAEVGLNPIIAGRRPAVLNFCGRLSLQSLAAFIRGADGFIGIDSGPAHFANAFARPSVVLSGHYRSFQHYMAYTGFLSQNAAEMVISWPGPAADIPVNEVLGRCRKVFGTIDSAHPQPQ